MAECFPISLHLKLIVLKIKVSFVLVKEKVFHTSCFIKSSLWMHCFRHLPSND